FLDPEFTLAQLREVHEIILGHPLDPANFRRQMLASKTLEETGHSLAGVKHRPAKTYRYRPEED
ncbi:TPA: ADP-ribose pyrophosphatase, partial [Staphylococcus aureus]|nr:ADP-ribose pyrophosphatase [Staphylococcus aureus]